MQSIILADRSGEEIYPFNQEYAVATLPVAGKAIIQHVVENCQSCNVDEIFIVLDKDDDKVQKVLGTGRRWSVNIHYIYKKHGQSYRSVLAQLGKKISFPIVAMRGDVVQKHWLQLEDGPKLDCATIPGDIKTGVVSLMSKDTELEHLNWSAMLPTMQQLDTPEAALNYYPIHTLENYHRAVMHAVKGMNNNLNQIGDPIHDSIRLGKLCEFTPRCLIDGRAQIDDYSHVDSTSELSGNIYIGKHCIIDKNVSLKNSVVLDNSFVGGGITIENAIVSERFFYRVDLGCELQLSDDAFLCSTQIKQGSKLQQLVGAFLLCFVWPLVLLAWVTPKEATTTNSKRHWKHTVNLILAVAKGEIRLFGVDPAHQSSNEIWSNQFNLLPKGLLSFAQIHNASGLADSDYELMEIYNATISWYKAEKWCALASLWRQKLRHMFTSNKRNGVKVS
jgi:NDP-sugar pyrophosphorylase family protein